MGFLERTCSVLLLAPVSELAFLWCSSFSVVLSDPHHVPSDKCVLVLIYLLIHSPHYPQQYLSSSRSARQTLRLTLVFHLLFHLMHTLLWFLTQTSLVHSFISSAILFKMFSFFFFFNVITPYCNASNFLYILKLSGGLLLFNSTFKYYTLPR